MTHPGQPIPRIDYPKLVNGLPNYWEELDQRSRKVYLGQTHTTTAPPTTPAKATTPPADKDLETEAVSSESSPQVPSYYLYIICIILLFLIK